MNYIRPSAERGQVNIGWLDSRHSFSFGHYYDPKHMGFSVLRVINDDSISPGAGFDTHGHRDMEIITYVTKGALQHKDSMGNEMVVPAGEVQRMTAGSGIMHSEFNASQSESVELLQIWILPGEKGLTPGYQQAAIPQHGQMTPLVTPEGENGALKIHQNASISRLQLKGGESYMLTTDESRSGYLHVVKGSGQADELSLSQGDAFGLYQNAETHVVAGDDGLEALWFDLPMSVA